jgi:hypothetical protein
MSHNLMMKRETAVLLACISALAPFMVPGLPVASDLAEWQIYRNAKYGYEIRYPEGFEAWPTGPAGERDGRAIRVGRKERSAPAPILDIQLNLTMPTLKSLADAELRDMDVAVVETDMNGIPAREITYRWKINGEIVFVELYFRDVSIVFHAQAGIHDARNTIWWKIISTFHFKGE